VPVHNTWYHALYEVHTNTHTHTLPESRTHAHTHCRALCDARLDLSRLISNLICSRLYWLDSTGATWICFTDLKTCPTSRYAKSGTVLYARHTDRQTDRQTHTHTHKHTHAHTRTHTHTHAHYRALYEARLDLRLPISILTGTRVYGVATVRRLLHIISLFCKRAPYIEPLGHFQQAVHFCARLFESNSLSDYTVTMYNVKLQVSFRKRATSYILCKSTDKLER